MAKEFQQHGRALIANGYLIIPIRSGHKSPALDHWQNARLGIDDLNRYPNHGVGILCGQGAHPIAAIDVDTHDANLAARFTSWCHEHLGMTCERIGQAPKVLLPYRASAEGWGKATGAWFEDIAGERHRLEVLGRGQQFVAYHIHPETGRPYEWVDLLGGLDEMRANELPVITAEQIAEALQVFEQMAFDAGLVKAGPAKGMSVRQVAPADDDPLMNYEPPVGLDIEGARRLLGYVDNEEYDTWLRVGMSLHHEFGGDIAALDLWEEWSSTAANYTGRESLELRWEGFGQSGRRPTTAKWLLKIGNENKREALKLEKRNTREELLAAVNEAPDTFELLGDVARRAGTASANDVALRAELTGAIQRRFKELSGSTLPVADARRAMAGNGQTKIRPKRERTEFGNAERMLDHYGQGLMYVHEIDTWYAWTGVYWRKVSLVELEHLAKETIRALPDELKDMDSDEEREAFFKFCAVSQRAAMVSNMVKLASSDPRVVVSIQSLDRDMHLLGVANGVVDLHTGKLLLPAQEYCITTITDIEYNAKAKAPLFERTVADVFNNDPELVSFFQRLIGYSLLGKPDEDVLVIPYGSGSNGKSTVLGAIRDALGNHARMAQADTFLSNGPGGGSAGSAREDVLRLRGARFVYVTEPDEGSELREGLIKSMTGGEPIPARGLYSKATIEVAPSWVTFMPTNHRPIVKGDDHAIWRRLLPVPFTRNFDKDLTVVKDPHRAEKLKAEAPGILRWCVEGAIAYRREGLNPPASVRAARDDYKSDMDLLAEWLDECCDLGPAHVESNAALWSSWEAFAKSRGELKLISSAKSLGRRLQSRGFLPVLNSAGLRGRGFKGVHVKPTSDF